MTSDVRALLHEAAASPTTTADVVGAMTTARRRRRRLGLGAGALAVAVAVVTIGLVINGGDGSSARVAIGPRQPAGVPEGWTPVDVDPGIRLAIPPGWTKFPTEIDPPSVPLIAVGTSRPGEPGNTSMIAACTPGLGQLPTRPGTWLSLFEYPDGAATEVTGPGGDIDGVVDRPADFTHYPAIGPVCPFVGGAASGDLGAAAETIAFRDAGRVFAVRVVTAFPAGSTPDFEPANQVLNTLQISPLEPVTTKTGPATTTTEPAAATTTSPPVVPTSADEQEITRVFVEWQRVHTDDEIPMFVEDGGALLDLIHQGMAQHSASDLAGYSGRVESVTMDDADHATVQYTLLSYGQPVFGVRTGTAVKIDSVWKVSRDTECALLSMGGLICPPRSNP